VNQQVAVIEQVYKPLTAAEMQMQVNTIQHVMEQVMIKDVHYGKIPGCKEPSLYKPGAEKIMVTFRLSADPEITDLSTNDQVRYQVKVRLISPSGVFVGAGIGECSSSEEKYKWRKAICKEEFEETPPERRREKWCKGWDNKPNYKAQQIRTEPADLANTVLKMAKKRALVDAVLTATAASDCFTQDVEDLPDGYIGDDYDQRQPTRNDAPPAVTVSEDQAKQLRTAAEFAGKDEAYVCQKARVQRIEDIQASRFGAAINHLKKLALGDQNADSQLQAG